MSTPTGDPPETNTAAMSLLNESRCAKIIGMPAKLKKLFPLIFGNDERHGLLAGAIVCNQRSFDQQGMYTY